MQAKRANDVHGPGWAFIRSALRQTTGSRDGSAVVVDQLCGWVPGGESDADRSCLLGRGADLADVVAGAGATGGCRVPNPEQVEPSDVATQPTPHDQQIGRESCSERE